VEVNHLESRAQCYCVHQEQEVFIPDLRSFNSFYFTIYSILVDEQ